MSGYSSHFDNQPLRYWNGRPIYLTAYLTMALGVGIVVTMLLTSAAVPATFLVFYPDAFAHGMLWQPFTYFLVNPIDFFTPLGVACFYSWGVEIEKYLGRRRFVLMCAGLLGVPVLYFSALRLMGIHGSVAGDFLLLSGLLIAFATLYPDMDYLWGWIPLKWFAFASIACGSIMYFPARDWIGLTALWLNCAAAYLMIRSTRGLIDFKSFVPAFLKPKPKFRVVPKPEPRAAGVASSYRPAPSSAAESEVDSLLDKIARSGLQSLTAAERERLEKARQAMLRKDR